MSLPQTSRKPLDLQLDLRVYPSVVSTLRNLPRHLLTVLLIAGAALFVIGIGVERNAISHHTESAATETVTAAKTTAKTTAEATAKATAEQAEATGEATAEQAEATGEAGAEGVAHTEATATTSSSEPSGETVLGVNLESNALVVVAVAVSLALAALAWFRRHRAVFLTIAAFAIMFTIFDIAEVAHQVKESRVGVAVLAAFIALVHAITAVIAQQQTATHVTALAD